MKHLAKWQPSWIFLDSEKGYRQRILIFVKLIMHMFCEVNWQKLEMAYLVRLKFHSGTVRRRDAPSDDTT